jgi:hypothetical protein
MVEKLKPPYIRKYASRENIQIWLVDGEYIRKNIDEEFTNFGQHYRFTYIPVDEFWIDMEAQDQEYSFFIDHLFAEFNLMKAGKNYDEAITAADEIELQHRRKAKDDRQILADSRGLPDLRSVHLNLWKKLENGVSVWVVDGRLVRSLFDRDFTEGGHYHVYEFVPKDEVWIDDAIEENERRFVLLHELHEFNQMGKGMPYIQAHAESSKLELKCRQHQDELHDALAAEGWA